MAEQSPPFPELDQKERLSILVVVISQFDSKSKSPAASDLWLNEPKNSFDWRKIEELDKLYSYECRGQREEAIKDGKKLVLAGTCRGGEGVWLWHRGT